MIVKKCDICGTEMSMITPRYKVVFDSWLYRAKKDICVSCFERIKDEIRQADTSKAQMPEYEAWKEPFETMVGRG